MIRDIMFHRCDIYRLQDISDYDFTGSEDGEVDEDWRLVAVDVRAKFGLEDTPFQRRSDAIVDVGSHRIAVEASTDVQNADRIYREEGENGPEYYEVVRVKYIKDFMDKAHHKELICNHVDWTPPVYIIPWAS